MHQQQFVVIILLQMNHQSSCLDFTFEDDVSCVAESTRVDDDGTSFDASSAVEEEDMRCYMSRATDDLGLKITSVRNVWNSDFASNSEKE